MAQQQAIFIINVLLIPRNNGFFLTCSCPFPSLLVDIWICFLTQQSPQHSWQAGFLLVDKNNLFMLGAFVHAALKIGMDHWQCLLKLRYRFS